MANFLPEKTVRYKTYVKTALVEALRGVFQNHPDTLLAKSKIGIDYPRSEADFPSMIVRFFERDIHNAGVGHTEHLTFTANDPTGVPEGTYLFKHYFYGGDLEFAIYTLSSQDRDLMADTLVQTIAMGDLQDYTNHFFDRIYPDEGAHPTSYSLWHFININADQIEGFGETQGATQWGSEDDLMYQTSYRVKIFGEFYSLPPTTSATALQTLRKAYVYPYVDGVDPVPEGDTRNTNPWEPPLPD